MTLIERIQNGDFDDFLESFFQLFRQDIEKYPDQMLKICLRDHPDYHVQIQLRERG